MTPQMLAERILQAAGSGLHHFTPDNRARIVEEAKTVKTDLMEQAAQYCDGIAADYKLDNMTGAPWNKGAVDGAKECADLIRDSYD